MVDFTDQVLVENTLCGDQLAFAELVRRYQSAIWRTVRRRLFDHFESEDAMQEVFLRAYTSLHRFDTSRPFDRWILRIATNYCVDVLRHRRCHQSWPLTEYKEVPVNRSWETQPELSSLTSAELRRVTRLVLNAVKPNNRDAFVLRELEGLDYTEVAKALQITPLAARARVFRARREMHRKLRRYLCADSLMPAASSPASGRSRQAA